MRLHEYTESTVDVLELRGEIDMHFAPVLRRLLQGKRNAGCRTLLLDMTAVTFIDSTGLSAILEYLRDASDDGDRFCIGGVSGDVATIFEVVRLDRAMAVFENVEAAKAALVSGRVPSVSEPLFRSAA